MEYVEGQTLQTQRERSAAAKVRRLAIAALVVGMLTAASVGFYLLAGRGRGQAIDSVVSYLLPIRIETRRRNTSRMA